MVSHFDQILYFKIDLRKKKKTLRWWTPYPHVSHVTPMLLLFITRVIFLIHYWAIMYEICLGFESCKVNEPFIM
jgi:hypothetical protein